MRLERVALVILVTAAGGCKTGPPINCRSTTSITLATEDKLGNCVAFRDLPGNCTLQLFSTTKASCTFRTLADVRIAVTKNGSDEMVIGTGDSPRLQEYVGSGYNELRIYNNHPSTLFQTCTVEASDVQYCCWRADDLEVRGKWMAAGSAKLQRLLDHSVAECNALLKALLCAALMASACVLIYVYRQQVSSKTSFLEPLLQSNFQEAGPLPGVGRFQPSVSIFDYVGESGRQVRCIRIEAPGRKVAGGHRSISGHVEVEGAKDHCGTIVRVHLLKESDLPVEASFVQMPGNRLNEPRGVNTSGTWEKTFCFKDGAWEVLEPESAKLGGANSLDMHGVWQIQLVRTLPSPARVMSVTQAPRCPQYDLGSTCDGSDAVDVPPEDGFHLVSSAMGSTDVPPAGNA